MPDFVPILTRRRLVAGAAALAALPAQAAAPGDGRLAFAVFRNGVKVGEQAMSFVRSGGLLTVTSRALMTVKLGPLPVYRYDHRSKEQWRDGRFERLETSTSSNGEREAVTARRSGEALSIQTASGAIQAPADAAPLSHWNPEAFAGPLFNPQTGEMLKVSARKGAAGDAPGNARAATHWVVRGAASIDDWYDSDGVWEALRGVLKDRSIMEYRRA
jgi:hypothetical protein